MIPKNRDFVQAWIVRNLDETHSYCSTKVEAKGMRGYWVEGSGLAQQEDDLPAPFHALHAISGGLFSDWRFEIFRT